MYLPVPRWRITPGSISLGLRIPTNDREKVSVYSLPAKVYFITGWGHRGEEKQKPPIHIGYEEEIKRKPCFWNGEAPVRPPSINVSFLVVVDIDIHSLGCVNGITQWSWKFKGYTCNDCYSFCQGIQPPADSSFCPPLLPTSTPTPLLLWILLKVFMWKSQQSSTLNMNLTYGVIWSDLLPYFKFCPAHLVSHWQTVLPSGESVWMTYIVYYFFSAI